jgi:glucose-6-phosphate isomerase
MEADRTLPRLWDGDVTVWAEDPHTPEIADRLGWLGVGSLMAAELDGLRRFAEEALHGTDRVVLLGMGGSSLCSEVLWSAFGPQPGHPRLQVLDSTHPAAVRRVLDEGDLGRTLFLVASKSGTTIETDSFNRLFWEETGQRGAQFVAITDPGTPLERLGIDRGFRRVFLNPPDIGGRFSALSFFGLVPAVLMGIDLAQLLERAETMANRCGPDVSAADNPGATLGVILAQAALAGRDKLTLLTPPPFGSLGVWIEQLVAESTGKDDQGVLPVTGEPFEAAIPYWKDRMFVAIGPRKSSSAAMDARVADIEARQEPLARLTISSPLDLGAEFFRWEMATAVAGAVMRINPFDQPNVAESKARTKEILAGGASLTAPDELQAPAVREFLSGVRPGDYIAVQAFAAPGEDGDRRLAAVSRGLRHAVDAVVTVGYGPRYLHSTGQLHKGGQACGHFIQIVDEPARDVEIPGRDYGFAGLMAAQADGDYLALRDRGRPVLRVTGTEDLLAVL